MTGGLFLCSIATCPPLPLPPFYAATLIPMHPSYATIVLISFTLLLFWCCHPSYHAILLMLPPFWCPLPCHLLPLPSLWCCHLLTLHPSYNAILLVPFTLPSFWCPLIISTAELRSFVGSVNLTSVACSSGSPDKSDHRQTQWRGKWIALSMDFVTTILPIKFKFWLRSQ